MVATDAELRLGKIYRVILQSDFWHVAAKTSEFLFYQNTYSES